MATAHRVGPDHDIALRLDTFRFDPAHHRLTLQAGDHAYRLDVDGVSDDGWLRLASRWFSVDRAVVQHAHAAFQVVVSDASRRVHLAVEPLHFHASFFAPLVDFTAMPLPGHSAGPYPRPGRLAVCTHVYNDDAMLRLWERHYAGLVPQADLYVIDHGSDRPAQDALSAGTQCVRIPRGPTDHANIASFCSHFQRFLLTQYRWVLHVDVDELVVAEDGPAAWLARLDAHTGPGRIVGPAWALDLVMNPATELPLDLHRPITHQRRHLVPNPEMRKPVLASRPTTWGPGFHHAIEAHAVVEDPRLWLVHLGRADLGLVLARNRKWLAADHSAADQRDVDHAHRARGETELRAAFRDALLHPDAMAVPAWMHGVF